MKSRHQTHRAARLVAAACLLAALPCAAWADGDPVKYREVLGLESRTVVWIVAQLHLMFGAFVLGVPIFAVIIELVGTRTGDARYDRLAHEFTKLLTAAFSTTAALGGLMSFLLIGLYPDFMSHLGTAMHETFYIYASLFFGEAFTLYLYYYGWDRLQARTGRARPIRIGLWVLTAVLAAVTCGMMLTGGEGPARLREEGATISAHAQEIGAGLNAHLETVAAADAVGDRADADALAGAVQAALHWAQDAAPAGEHAAEAAAWTQAAAVVQDVGAAALGEEGADTLLAGFSQRLALAAEEARLDGVNAAAAAAQARWGRVGLVALALLAALGCASYATSLKGLHLFLGLLLNVFGITLMMLANSWATFMMAPSGVNAVTAQFAGTTWGAVNNVLWMPLNIHRLLANVVFGGFVVAAYAAVRFLGARTDAQRAHYDWMGYLGNFVGMAAMLTLPFAGYYFGREVYSYSPIMGNNMMGGAFSWAFILQAVLIGMLFVGANYYLWVGMQRIEGAQRYRRYIPINTFILMLCFAVWLTPHNLPLSGAEKSLLGGVQYHPVLKYFGLMPAKNAAVNFIILSTFFSFLMYRRANKGAVPPFATHGWLGKGVVAGAGAASLLLLLWYVGVIRGLDPAELSVPLENVWVFDWTVRILQLQMAAILAVVLLTYANRGVGAQFLYFGICALVAAGFFGVWGFVTMVNANAFLRNIAVCQVLVVLTCLILNTTIDVFLFRGAPAVGQIRWGHIPARAQYALVLTCMSVVLLMGLMGYVRSGLREDWHIFGVLRDTSAGAYTPSLAYMTRVVSLITVLFFGLVAFVFWLAHLGDPPEAPEAPASAEGAPA